MTVRAEIRPIPQPPREVVLTMPYDVAVTLKDLLSHVAGGMGNTYRADTELVWYALDAAQVENTPDRFNGSATAKPRPSHKD